MRANPEFYVHSANKDEELRSFKTYASEWFPGHPGFSNLLCKGRRRSSLEREGSACCFSMFSHVPCPLLLVATKRDVIFLISALDKVD